MLWQASLSTPRWYSDKLVTGIFIIPVVRCLGSVPWPRVKMDAGRVSTYSSFARSVWQHCPLVMGRKPVLVPFFPMVLQASSSMSRWYASDFLSMAQGVTTFEFSRTLLSMRKRMRPSSRGPFSAICWYALPGPALCGCFGYAAYFTGVLCMFTPAVHP